MSHPIKTAASHRSGRGKANHVNHAGANKAAAANKVAAANKFANGVPLIVVYWAVGLGVFGYVGSRFVFTAHPLHWTSLAGGVLLGILIGYIWYWKRGDVSLF